MGVAARGAQSELRWDGAGCPAQPRAVCVRRSSTACAVQGLGGGGGGGGLPQAGAASCIGTGIDLSIYLEQCQPEDARLLCSCTVTTLLGLSGEGLVRLLRGYQCGWKANRLGTDPRGGGGGGGGDWGRHCSSPAWSEAWQFFYPETLRGQSSSVGAIILSARQAGIYVNLILICQPSHDRAPTSRG